MTLWIRGAEYQHQELDLPQWITAFDFRTNITRREVYINEKKIAMRLKHLRTIIKFKWDFEITVQFKSDEFSRPFQISPEIFSM